MLIPNYAIAMCLVFLVLLALSYYQGYRLDKKEKAERKKRNEDFLKANEGMTAMAIFEDVFGTQHSYGPFEAGVEGWYTKEVHFTAKDKARCYLEECADRRYFINDKGEFVPLWKVNKFWVQ